MAEKPTFDWQGHRGCRGLMPENSIPAFLHALDYPIKTLELDVAVSKDQKIIVSHEPYFSHHICAKPGGAPVKETEADSLLIYEMTYDEIKKFDCGSRGNERFLEQKPMVVNKPSLEDVVIAVNAFCSYNKRDLPYYNIEIKSEPAYYGKATPPPADFVKLLLERIEVLGIKEYVCIQSFDVNVMLELNLQAPEVTNAYLVENLEGFEANMAKLDFTPDIYSPYFKVIDQELVSKVHQAGMRLIPWTVNEVKDMDNLIELGVDGIITDYPDRITDVRIKK